MSNRNIAIVAAAVFAIAGLAYTQLADSDEIVATETTETMTTENAQNTETAPAANTADNAGEITTTENAIEPTVEAAPVNEVE